MSGHDASGHLHVSPESKAPYAADVLERLHVDAAEVIARYPQKRSALLPLLHLVQSVDGYVTGRGVSFCAEVLDLTEAEVSGVATFYTQYKRHPNGDYTVGVCTNTLCAVMGGDHIFDRVSEHLGIGHDETTEDGRITLERVECNAACDYAPVVMANWEFFDNQTPESTIGLVEDLRAGKDVAPTRGADQGLHLQGGLAGARGLRGRPRRRGRGRRPGLAARPAHRQRARLGRPARRLRPSNGSHARSRREGRIEVTDTLTPILTKFWDDPQSWTLATYERHDGYKALTKALDMEPQAIIDAVKDSSIRGRGGAGFPTGMKWSFMSPPDGGPRYLVVNADESEPGTCKDVPLMMANPHALIEGVIISSYAIGCEHAFIYLRGEVVHVYRRLLRAVEEARAAGYLGDNVGGKGVKVDITVHAGAGAYICGEETALLDSLEGRRGQPRLKPPFPGAAGLYARPTSVNNVESIASVPGIILEGSDWFKGMGTEKSTGFGIFSLSGHVANPGQFEAPLGITMRELIDLAGGMRGGRKLKFWTPGGSLDADLHRRAPRRAARLRLGRRGRLDARHPRAAGLRRDRLGRARRRALDRLLRPRVVRQVHAVPRGHVVAAPDHEPHRGGPGHAGRHRQARRHLRQHPRPQLLRPR